MQQQNVQLYRWLATATAIGCLLQAIGVVRYINRAPDDWIGIGLYVVTAVALAIASMGFALRVRKS